MSDRKILYVEDELTKNIPMIRKLFKSFLTPDILENLENMLSNSNGRAIAPEKIEEVVNESKILEVDFKFSSALDKIINKPHKYFLFIIDRNLSKTIETEEIEEIKKQNIGYDDDYETREGDFLFIKLLFNTRFNLHNNFYFLTGNNEAKFRFEKSIALRDNFNLEEFRKNKIDRSNTAETTELAKYIKKYSENYEYIIKNQNYLEILKRYKISDDIFLALLKEHDKIDLDNFNNKQNEIFFKNLLLLDEEFEDINNSLMGYNLLLIRKVFTDILEVIAKEVENKKDFYPNWWLFSKDKNKKLDLFKNKNLNVKNIIRFLADKHDRYNYSQKYIDKLKKDINNVEMKKENSKLKKQLVKEKVFQANYEKLIIDNSKNYIYNEKLEVSSIIAHELYSIWEITSSFGAHKSKGYAPTIETINSLNYQLKEIIIWFDSVMKKLK